MRGIYYVIKVGLCLGLDMLRCPWPQERLTTQRDATAPQVNTPAYADTGKQKIAGEQSPKTNPQDQPATEAVA